MGLTQYDCDRSCRGIVCWGAMTTGDWMLLLQNIGLKSIYIHCVNPQDERKTTMEHKEPCMNLYGKKIMCGRLGIKLISHSQ